MKTKTADQYLREMLGDKDVQIAILRAENDQLRERLAERDRESGHHLDQIRRIAAGNAIQRRERAVGAPPARRDRR